MMNNKLHECRYLSLYQDVTQSVDCPFHYTEGCKAFPLPRWASGKRAMRAGKVAHLSPAWNGQVDSSSHRKGRSAWPGWKPGKIPGPLSRFTTNLKHLFITMSTISSGIVNRPMI